MKGQEQLLAPDRVVETVWRAVEGPRLCNAPHGCGHAHYGRVSSTISCAPQWNICEGHDCGCTALRHVPGDQP